MFRFVVVGLVYVTQCVYGIELKVVRAQIEKKTKKKLKSDKRVDNDGIFVSFALSLSFRLTVPKKKEKNDDDDDEN